MKPLPSRYRWLSAESGPRMLRNALDLHGTIEGAGAANSPVILNWAEEVGLSRAYSEDAIPWCGLFMAVVAKRSGWDVVSSPLWARSWLTFGRPKRDAELGDVLVFRRGIGGHVGLYVAEDPTHYHVLGGNQSDAVTITRIAKDRCIGIREPIWRVAKPTNIRRVFMSATGAVSTNEA